MKQTIILTLCLLGCCVASGESLAPDSLFIRLDASIANRSFYIEQKNDTLIELKNRLLNAASLEQKYELSKELVSQYSNYENAPTLYYADQCLEIARQLGDRNLITESLLRRANYLRFSGLTHESLSIPESIDPDKLPVELRKTYYKVYMHVCHSYTKLQNDSHYRAKYIELALRNADSYLALERGDESEYLSVQAYKFYLEKNYQQAINTIKTLQKRDDVKPYLSAEYLYYLGLVYLELGDNYKRVSLEAFTRSAIISNELAMTNLLSLLYVGRLLINSDNPYAHMADEYINVAVEDAVIFGDSYRADLIKSTYYYTLQINLERAEARKKTLEIVAVVVSIFLVTLGFCLFLLLRSNKENKNNRKKLSVTNARLQDSALRMEAYLKLFINRNLVQIEKAEKYKKQLLKMLNGSTSCEKIKQDISSMFDMNEDYNSLLADFDKSITDLFPHFADEVNKLLKPDQLYTYDQNSANKLNTELRILALVRLGVADNKQIASFFRITLQSVYNYRSKARGRAVNEDTFDDDIMKIL